MLILDFQCILRNIFPQILIDWLIGRCVLRFCPASSYFVSPIFPNAGQPPTSPKLSKEKPQPFSPHNSYQKKADLLEKVRRYIQRPNSEFKRLVYQTQWEKTQAGFFSSQKCNIETDCPPPKKKKKKKKKQTLFQKDWSGHLASEASARLPEKWDRLAADVARGSKNFSTSLHLVIMVMLLAVMITMMEVIMVIIMVVEIMVMIIMFPNPTPSLSISDDWSMLFWCLKAENGGFTPALICFQ